MLIWYRHHDADDHLLPVMHWYPACNQLPPVKPNRAFTWAWQHQVTHHADATLRPVLLLLLLTIGVLRFEEMTYSELCMAAGSLYMAQVKQRTEGPSEANTTSFDMSWIKLGSANQVLGSVPNSADFFC